MSSTTERESTMPTEELRRELADGFRGVHDALGTLREDFKVRMALSEQDRAALHQENAEQWDEITAIKSRLDVLAAAPGAAALAGWRHMIFLALSALAGATLTGMIFVLKGGHQ